MLTCLRVRNFAIIDELEVELGPGLNVVTGETGAGKSILVDALSLVLGARGAPEMVRTGADEAEVEALFEVPDGSPLAERLAEAGLDAGEDLVVRRIVAPSGRTRAYVNGRLAAAGTLAELAGGLVDISSQHEQHTLGDASTHLGYLDAFGGLDDARARMAAAHAALVTAADALAALDAEERDRVEREDLLRFQLQEIDALDPSADEQETLGVERERLRHATRLATAAGRAADALYADDDAMCGRIARFAAELEDAARIDPALAEPARQLEEARTQIEEAARDLEDYARSVELDPDRLAEVEERLDRLKRLARKYGGSLGAVLERRDRAREELDALERHDERRVQAERARDARLDEAAERARDLSRRRTREAKRLGRAIGEELRSLSMGGARVVVDVAPLSGGGALVVDGARLSPTGIDRAEFLIAPNRGEEARPLRRIASGGELSRAMLAIKRVLGGVGPGGLYVFDEVDAGVGGAVAEVLGRKLRDVAAHHQVLCITHLPQIAVYADQHFRVHKRVVKKRTRSDVVRLMDGERLEEVARMLGGLEVTERTRAAAREMLELAAR